MKPTKNVVFCIGCQRPKMLFESQSKADNFMKYNSDAILEENGKAPVRSYYCEFCCGYHVTSDPSLTHGQELNKRDKSLQDKLVNNFKKSEKFLELRESIIKRLESCKRLINMGKVDEAEDLLDVCELYLTEKNDRDFSMRDRAKLTTLRGRIDVLRRLLPQLREVLNLPLDQQLAFIADDSVGSTAEIRGKVANIILERDVMPIVDDNDKLIDKNQLEGITERIAYCLEILKSIKTAKKNKKITTIEGKLFYQSQLVKKKTTNLMNQKTAVACGESCDHDNNKYSHPETKEKPKGCVLPANYKATLITLIKKLELIAQAYEKKDYDVCEDLIDVTNAIIAEFEVDDDNIRLIRSHLDRWNDVIFNIGN